MSLVASLAQGQFTGLSNTDTIRLFALDFNLELEYLKNAMVTVESGQMPPLGGYGESNKTPSQLLFEEDFVEVNRTLLSVLALKWVLANDYNAFTGCQSTRNKLKRESFAELRGLFLERLHSPSDIYVLLIRVAIADVGKSPDLARKVEQLTGTSLSNHDEVAFLAAKTGLLPSVESLSTKSRGDLILSLKLGWNLNIAQFAQAENVPGSLSSLVGFKEHVRAYNIEIMDTLLDVAGAAAHGDSRCCARMTETVYRDYMVAISALNDLISERGVSLRECYDRVLEAKAKTLELQGFDLLSPTMDEERALLRLLAMGRVSDKDLAKLFKEAFQMLPALTRRELVEGLNRDGMTNDVAIVPFYAPALFAELLKNMRDNGEILVQALAALMRFLSRVTYNPESQVGEARAIVECNLSPVKDVISSPNFKTNPDILDRVPLP